MCVWGYIWVAQYTQMQAVLDTTACQTNPSSARAQVVWEKPRQSRNVATIWSNSVVCLTRKAYPELALATTFPPNRVPGGELTEEFKSTIEELRSPHTR